MRTAPHITLADVQNVYSGPEGDLWELVMGQQIHVGGLHSSTALADRAGIAAGSTGIDLCCCNGAGMRFLLRFRGVARMCGVDATSKVLQRARQRCAAEGLSERVEFVEADVCATGLPDGCADFAWGEDAWCYVADKPKLVAEAVRLVRRGGTVAFTDWVEGPVPLSEAEARRFLRFMKFPTLATLDDYREMLRKCGCEVVAAEDTGRMAPCVDLYLEMLNVQLTYDALRLLGFDTATMEGLAGEMNAFRDLARAGKVVQGRIVARKAG